jgi:hypothetical protein
VSGLLVAESGCAELVVVLSVFVLFGSEAGEGVSQAPMASAAEMPSTINNFFID